MALKYSSNRLLDAIMVSSSLAVFSSGSIYPQEIFGPNQSFSFGQDFEYYLAYQLYCEKQNPLFDAQFDVYLTGSAFPSETNGHGYLVHSHVCKVGDLQKNFGLIENEFTALNTGDAQLKFVLYSGIWHVAAVKFQVANWPGYNPDEATIDIPVDGIRYRKVRFKAELYDVNNNAIPTNNFIIESPDFMLTGSNTVIQGIDNRITGTVIVSRSGSGAVIGTDTSGSYIGLQGGITSASLPRPVYPPTLPQYSGPPIIVMYSGSSPYTNNPQSPSSSMGLQIASGDPSGSFFDYNTLTGLLTIRGAIELLPGTPLSASLFASGSDAAGNLALAQIQALVNGSGSFLPSGTFIDGNMVVSPIIAGNFGYFAGQMGVGNIIGNNGIVLTALGYSSSLGVYQPNAPAIYIGAGYAGHQNTPFLVASSSNGPVFTLGDRLIAEMSGGFFTVKVSGSLAIDVNNTGQYQDIRGVIQGVSNLFDTKLSFSSSLASASLYAVSASITQTQALINAQLSASIVSVSASLAQASATGSVVDAVNKIILPTSVKTVPGLYLESASISFWQPFAGATGNQSPNYPVIINSNGSFRFAGSGSWSGSVANGAFTDQIGFNNGNLLVQTKNILVSTPGLQFAGLAVSASVANFIKLGANAQNITLANSAGFYVDGAGNFRVGSDTTGSDYIQLTPGNALIVSSSTFFLGTPTLRIGSTGNNGVIKLGANAANITLTRNAGFYVDGLGNFRIGSDTSGSDFILQNVGNAMLISSSQYYLRAGNIRIDSFTSGGLITLGAATSVDTGSGFYADGNSHWRLGSPGTASLTFDPISGSLIAKNMSIVATVINAGVVTAPVGNFDTLNTSDISIDNSITVTSIVTENETINTSSMWNNVSGSVQIGPYNVTQYSSTAGTGVTGSRYPGASATANFAASAPAPSQVATLTQTIALNNTSSLSNAVNLQLPFSCALVSHTPGGTVAQTYAYANVVFSWKYVGAGSYTTLASYNYTANTATTYSLNIPANGDFNFKATLTCGADFTPNEHGGGYAPGSSAASLTLVSSSWPYPLAAAGASTLTRFGANLSINPTIQSPHLHMNGTAQLLTSSLSAGDVWFEASGSSVNQSQGTLKYFSGNAINSIVGGSDTFFYGSVGPTITVDWNNGPTQWVQMAAANISILFANGEPGVEYFLYLQQSGGAHTVTLSAQTPTGFTLSSGANKIDVISLMKASSPSIGAGFPVWRASLWGAGYSA